MTVDEELAEHGPPPDPAAEALERHAASIRRQRKWYYAILVALAALCVAVAAAVWFNGEITHVHLRTAASPAPSVTLGTPSAQPTLAWQSPDATAIGAPLSGGTVVTYSQHSVTGRDALTGKALWSYTRTDRDVCQVAQQQGKAIAFYRHGRNCDEVTTLDTGTGKRIWERTLDENALPINGRPLVIPGIGSIFVTTPSAIYAIQVGSAGCDPSSGGGCGSDAWTYTPPAGCSLKAVVPGSSGVLISEHCADGDHLVLRDPNAGTDSKDPKPIKWRLNNTSAIPVAADTFVGALDPATHELVTYTVDKGKVVDRTALNPPPATTGPVQQLAANQSNLVRIGGTVYRFNSSGSQMWATPADAMPTVTSPEGATPPDLDGAVILVPTSSGAAALDGTTGSITSNYAIPTTPAGSLVYPLGNGLLVAGASTTVYR